jgi:hypothetical protein
MPLETEMPISKYLITKLSILPDLAGLYLTVVGVYFLSELIVLNFGEFNKVNPDFP